MIRFSIRLRSLGKGLRARRFGALGVRRCFFLWSLNGLLDLKLFKDQFQRQFCAAFGLGTKAVFLVPVQLQAQIGNDRVSVLDGPRMGGAFGYQGGVGLSLEALLRAGIAERESQKLLNQPFARQIMPAHQRAD